MLCLSKRAAPIKWILNGDSFDIFNSVEDEDSLEWAYLAIITILGISFDDHFRIGHIQWNEEGQKNSNITVTTEPAKTDTARRKLTRCSDWRIKISLFTYLMRKIELSHLTRTYPHAVDPLVCLSSWPHANCLIWSTSWAIYEKRERERERERERAYEAL